MGEKYMVDPSVGEKYMGEKYVQEEFKNWVKSPWVKGLRVVRYSQCLGRVGCCLHIATSSVNR